MRPFLIALSISLYGSVCFGQIDSTQNQTLREPLTTTRVPIPGVDTPFSGPGTMMQSPANPGATIMPEPDRKKRKTKTVPPDDPRGFGIAVPLGGKTKKDSLR